ncbi:MAG: MGMT family protein [Gemmatimonadaceae bacterium]
MSGAASSYERIYAAARRIPRGKVATYGQLAELAGLPGQARQAGYAMHAVPADAGVPWHRVMNARGEVSIRADPEAARLQRTLLEAEGVRFDAKGRVSLARCGWRPRRTMTDEGER